MTIKNFNHELISINFCIAQPSKEIVRPFQVFDNLFMCTKTVSAWLLESDQSNII